MSKDLPQFISKTIEECRSGPVFLDGVVIGFVTAGYRDDKRYYGYMIPSYELKRLLNRSFIIKSYNSLSDTLAMGSSYYQKALMESLTSVLWMDLPDAERMARKKNKMVLISVYTNWAGWSKLMDKNTYPKKRIIRYLNENYYAVRLDAETNDTIPFNQLTYTRNIDSDYHQLAYSLLESTMDFPSTVILDQDVNVLMVIPGYMDARKMEVVLHYFNEKAYLNQNRSFPQYEYEYWQRKDPLEGN